MVLTLADDGCWRGVDDVTGDVSLNFGRRVECVVHWRRKFRRRMAAPMRAGLSPTGRSFQDDLSDITKNLIGAIIAAE